MQLNTYNNKKNIKFEIQLVNKTINILKGQVRKIYKITKVIFNSGLVQKIVLGFVTVVFFIALKLATLAPNPSVIESGPGIQSQTQIVKFVNSTSKNDQIKDEDIQSPSVRKLLDLNLVGGDLNGNPGNPGARARGDLKSGKGKTSVLVEALAPQSYHASRPGAGKGLQTVSTENGLFGRFTARSRPDPSNPGCAGGPRSITVRSIQRDPESFDASEYKGGPNPFIDKFDYDNPNHTRENTDFSSQKRMNHAYDRHAEKCFDMKENRNKENLKKFKEKARSFIESPETEKINGSYRYETPAYFYKEKDSNLVAIVNATDNSFINVVNATESQLKSIQENNNFGLDTRPST